MENSLHQQLNFKPKNKKRRNKKRYWQRWNKKKHLLNPKYSSNTKIMAIQHNFYRYKHWRRFEEWFYRTYLYRRTVLISDLRERRNGGRSFVRWQKHKVHHEEIQSLQTDNIRKFKNIVSFHDYIGFYKTNPHTLNNFNLLAYFFVNQIHYKLFKFNSLFWVRNQKLLDDYSRKLILFSTYNYRRNPQQIRYHWQNNYKSLTKLKISYENGMYYKQLKTKDKSQDFQNWLIRKQFKLKRIRKMMYVPRLRHKQYVYAHLKNFLRLSRVRNYGRRVKYLTRRMFKPRYSYWQWNFFNQLKTTRYTLQLTRLKSYRLFMWHVSYRNANRRTRKVLMSEPYLKPEQKTQINLSEYGKYYIKPQLNSLTKSVTVNKYFLYYLQRSFIYNETGFIGLPFIRYNYDLKRLNLDKLKILTRKFWLGEDIKLHFLKQFLVIRSKNVTKTPLELKNIKRRWRKKKFLQRKRMLFLNFYTRLKVRQKATLSSYFSLPKAIQFLFIYDRLQNINVFSEKPNNFYFKLKQRYSFKFFKLDKWKKWKYNNHLRIYKLNYLSTIGLRKLMLKKAPINSYLQKKKKWQSLRTKSYRQWNFKRRLVNSYKVSKTSVLDRDTVAYYRYNLIFKKFFRYDSFTSKSLWVSKNRVMPNADSTLRKRAIIRKKVFTWVPFTNQAWNTRAIKRFNTRTSNYKLRWFNKLNISNSTKTNKNKYNISFSKLVRTRFVWASRKLSFAKLIPRKKPFYRYQYDKLNKKKEDSWGTTKKKWRLYRTLKLARKKIIFETNLNFINKELYYYPTQQHVRKTKIISNLNNLSAKPNLKYINSHSSLFNRKWILNKLNIKLTPRNFLKKYVNFNISSFLIYKTFTAKAVSYKHKLVKWYVLYDFVYSNDLRKKLFNRKKRMFMFNLVHRRFKKFKKSLFFKKWFPIKRYKIKILQNLYLRYLNESYNNVNNLFSILFSTKIHKNFSHDNFFAYQKMKNLYYPNEHYTRNKYHTYDVWREMYLRRIRFKPGYQRLWRRARIGIKEFMGWRYIYQKQLTKQLSKFKQSTVSTRLLLKNTTYKQIVMYSRLLPSEDSFTLFLRQKQLFLNGHIPASGSITCFRHDFIQLLISYSYYVYYKWLKNWTQIRSSKFRHLVYRKGKAYKYKIIKQRKQKSYYIPKWIYIVKYDFIDVKSYLEVDYFTLSAFIVYSPYLYYFHYLEHFDYLRTRILRLYNWKYLT